MRYSVLDKRVAAIIRWLERMKKSYSDGAIESALMDAECARADLETLRNDVWQKVRPSEHKSHDITIRILRYLSLAVIVILFHVAPLAKDNLPLPTVTVTEEIHALTKSQPKPIIIVREYEKPEVKPSKSESSPRRQSRRQAVQKKVQVNQKTASSRQAVQKTVPYDKVFSLVQTGQRALKENTSVISIKK